MNEKKQNMVLGTVGVALIVIGLLGYTGTLAKVRNQATLIIETNSTVTDINASTDSLTKLAPSPAYDYWQEGMSNWADLTEGTDFDSDENVYFMVTWMNATDSTVIGHAELTVTLPDGSTVSPSADTGQDYSASPNEGHMVSFRGVSGPQGDYSLDFQITGEYGTAPDGYFTINGQKATKDATITLHTNDLTFVFHPTQNVSAISSAEVEVLPIEGAEGEKDHTLSMSKQSDGTYKATDSLADGTYTVNGLFYSDTGQQFTAMSLRMTTGKAEVTNKVWFLPIIIGAFVLVIGADRQWG